MIDLKTRTQTHTHLHTHALTHLVYCLSSQGNCAVTESVPALWGCTRILTYIEINQGWAMGSSTIRVPCKYKDPVWSPEPYKNAKCGSTGFDLRVGKWGPERPRGSLASCQPVRDPISQEVVSVPLRMTVTIAFQAPHIDYTWARASSPHKHWN